MAAGGERCQHRFFNGQRLLCKDHKEHLSWSFTASVNFALYIVNEHEQEGEK